jgi:hypothetical protein
MGENTYEFVMAVLEKIAKYDMYGELFWRCDGEYAPVRFFLICNDLFAWACADLEELTTGNLVALDRAWQDLHDADITELDIHYNSDEDITESRRRTRLFRANCFACDLFCARMRKMRPQGACYKRYSKDLWPLFDACGPERETGIGNPCKPGE